MSNAAPLPDRLRGGVARIMQRPPGEKEADEQAMVPLQRSLERTLSRLMPGATPTPSPFRFQLTGGKPVLFMGNEALPLEPSRLLVLLNRIGVELQPGETIDLDGALAAWLIRPEASLVESNYRVADVNLRTLKSTRDRDHTATQSAESIKIRLRSRLTQLVSALQSAQFDAQLPVTAVSLLTPPPASSPVPAELPPPPPPPVAVKAPPPPPAAKPPAPDPFPPPDQELVTEALKMIVAAAEGIGFKYAVIGHVGCLARGSTSPARLVELFVAFEGPQREAILSAARAEGLESAPDDEPLHLQFETVPVHLRQANSSYQKQVISRAQPAEVLQTRVRVASVEDLMILHASTDQPRIVELLRSHSSKLDAGYLKKEGEAAGVFDRIRAAWGQLKQQG